ncbi:MAG: hypothetical protein LC114_26775 [Bryobacterales bacterium]|nr:hypothetical protein [Bryobacterales bacterium]
MLPVPIGVRYLERLLAIVSIAGGLTGLMATILSPLSTASRKHEFLALAMCIIYALGVTAGVALLERHRYSRLLTLIFFSCQVPIFQAFSLSYQFSSLFSWDFVIRPGWILGISWNWGSRWYASLFSMHDESVIGMNLIGVIGLAMLGGTRSTPISRSQSA